MEHNNFASIEGENLILCDADNSASTEFNMPDVETMMEEISQPMDMEKEGAIQRWSLPRQEAPLIDLLGEIRGLRGLRGRGQISDVEYARRRSQVLNRI